MNLVCIVRLTADVQWEFYIIITSIKYSKRSKNRRKHTPSFANAVDRIFRSSEYCPGIAYLTACLVIDVIQENKRCKKASLKIETKAIYDLFAI